MRCLSTTAPRYNESTEFDRAAQLNRKATIAPSEPASVHVRVRHLGARNACATASNGGSSFVSLQNDQC